MGSGALVLVAPEARAARRRPTPYDEAPAAAAGDAGSGAAHRRNPAARARADRRRCTRFGSRARAGYATQSTHARAVASRYARPHAWLPRVGRGQRPPTRVGGSAPRRPERGSFAAARSRRRSGTAGRAYRRRMAARRKRGGCRIRSRANDVGPLGSVANGGPRGLVTEPQLP